MGASAAREHFAPISFSSQAMRQQELAKQRGVSRQAIHVNKGVIKRPDGTVDEDATKTIAMIREDAERESLRKERAMADLKEMAAAQLRGELRATKQIVSEVGGMIVNAKNRLLAMANKLAPVVATEADAAVCQEIITKEVYLALKDLANWRLTDGAHSET